jgi:hypothetical protein
MEFVMDDLAKQIRDRYLEIFHEHFSKADGTPFYATDLVMFGILDRQIGLVEAMPSIFESKNIHALAPLLRVQLDSLLRLHAFRIVADMDELARHMLKGNSLRDFKDRDGNRLFDKLLVDSLKKELPWVEDMYETLSGWIHFSESHIFRTLSEDKGDRSMKVGIGSFREEAPPELLDEAKSALVEIHANTASLVEAYFAR